MHQVPDFNGLVHEIGQNHALTDHLRVFGAQAGDITMLTGPGFHTRKNKLP